jgi:hypothetical protein
MKTKREKHRERNRRAKIPPDAKREGKPLCEGRDSARTNDPEIEKVRPRQNLEARVLPVRLERRSYGDALQTNLLQNFYNYKTAGMVEGRKTECKRKMKNFAVWERNSEGYSSSTVPSCFL